jgi:signal transduction histidine kinase
MTSLRSAREEEGIRIAREIHDELGAALTSLRWDLEEMERINSEKNPEPYRAALYGKIRGMFAVIDHTIDVVRRISSELRPSILDDLGLASAVEWQAQQFQSRTGIQCRCECLVDSLNLNTEQSTAVFRIFQEALTNVLRHAHASCIDVTIEEEASDLLLTIRDDGRGIQNSEMTSPSALGLLGMHERAHLIGGRIEIVGVDGKGTTVTLRVPHRKVSGAVVPA